MDILARDTADVFPGFPQGGLDPGGVLVGEGRAEIGPNHSATQAPEEETEDRGVRPGETLGQAGEQPGVGGDQGPHARFRTAARGAGPRLSPAR